MACKIHTYLLLEYLQCSGSLYRTFCRLLVRGVCWPQGILMASLVHPFPWLRPCIHTIAVREHLDYCHGSLSDIVCNLCMVDKSNLTNRTPQGDRPLPAPREAGPWVPAFGGAGLGRLGEWRPPGPSRFRFRFRFRLCFFFLSSAFLFAPMRDCRTV